MKNRIVSFHCVLRDKLGKIVGSSFNNQIITGVPKSGEVLQGLAENLGNMKKGEKREIYITADQAFGLYDTSLVIEIRRDRLPEGEHLEVGSQVLTQSNDGQSRIFWVTKVAGRYITLDGNHPLAGQDLFFDIEATSVRDATPEEVEQLNPQVNQQGPSGYLH